LHSSNLKPQNSVQRTEDLLVALLSPISRLLVLGAVGIDEFICAAKRAYLRAAIDVIVPPGRRVNASRLSVATGMTRKEVSALLSNSKTEERSSTRRRGQQRALRVLRGWSTDPRFQAQDGRPAELPQSGQRKTFIQLVKLYGGDVTPNSVLRELERMHAVEVTNRGSLRLRRRRSGENLKPDYHLSELAKLFQDFFSAVTQPSSKLDQRSFFGFKDAVIASSGEAAAFMRTFSRRAAALLEGFEQWSAGRGIGKAVNREPAGAKRIGVGLYLLQADLPAGKSIAAPYVRRRRRMERKQLT
jgi:hypothetical protein